MTQHHNILVVDDEELVLRALERQLAQSGYPVVTARGASEALLKLQCFDISVVISDHLMADMTGIQLMSRVRRSHPDVVRILLTGHADLDTAIDSINSGEVFRLIVKPWDRKMLLATLQAAVAKVESRRDAKHLAARVRRHDLRLAEIESRFPGLTEVARNDHGDVIID